MRVFRFISLLSLFLMLNTTISAQEVTPKLADALKHTLDSMRQVLGVNGLSAAVQLSDNATWAAGSGVSTFSPIDSLTPDHVFETGSTTKTITAMCILQLADEGILSLDDSLFHWLPSYPNIDSTITIRQLLRHQSGIADILLNPVFQPTLLENTAQVWTAEDAMLQFTQAPAFQPGTAWGYSNTNYILLGMIVETATGNTFKQELEHRFFNPMGLDSYVNPAFDTVIEPYAHLWLDITGDGILDDAGSFITNWVSLFSIIGPPGGYFATPTDLAIWIKNSMSGSLVDADTWQMATQTVSTNLPNSIRYGLGIMESRYLGLTALGHGGDLSYSTQAQYFPEKDISIVVTSNDASITSWNLISTVRALLQVYIDCEDMLSDVDNKFHSNLSVTTFPNPFINEINIAIESSLSIEDVAITIFNTNGKPVWYETRNVHIGRNDVSISFPKNLPSSAYWLQIKRGEILLEHQLIIKR